MSDSTSSSGIGFTGLLAVAFIVLKLCGIIAWSWWWVLAPLWIPIALLLLVIAVYYGAKGLGRRLKLRALKRIAEGRS